MPSDATRKLTISTLLKPHRLALSIGLLAVIGESITNVLEPVPLKIVLDNVLQNKKTGGWLNHFVMSIAGSSKLGILEFAAIAVLVIALVDAICSYTEKYLTTSVGQWVMHDLRQMLYAHIQRLSLAYHDQTQSGDLISRVTSDIDAIQSFIASGLLGVIVNCLTLFGMIGYMFYINWRFTLVALSVAPPLFVLVYRYTRLIKKASREVRKKESEIVSVVQEVLSSIRVVKAFGREEYEEKRLAEESLESVEAALKARSLKAKLSPLVSIVVAIGTGVVLWWGSRLVLAGTLSSGSLVIFIMYLGKMYKPMQELSKMTDSWSKASVGWERINEVLQTQYEVKDLPGAVRAPALRGKIEFEGVTFGYSSDAPVLRDISLLIEPGQLAALVGPSGAGKTTLISLIPRFYDVQQGVVKIDGRDVRSYKQKSLRKQMSFVLQETLLFHGTIWYNIAYGRPDATYDEIIRAAKLANAHEFIEKLPQGYNTLVGERGVTLSGGQRQRIAIARAVIRNSPILILDEASSGLDSSSEKLVFEALDRLMEGKTTIAIAHRFSTIENADVIFVVQDGRIVERGKHDELVKAGGVYADLYELQFQDEARLPDALTTTSTPQSALPPRR